MYAYGCVSFCVSVFVFDIGCNDHYLEGTGLRISERLLDHAGRDRNSHLFKQSVTSSFRYE